MRMIQEAQDDIMNDHDAGIKDTSQDDDGKVVTRRIMVKAKNCYK